MGSDGERRYPGFGMVAIRRSPGKASLPCTGTEQSTRLDDTAIDMRDEQQLQEEVSRIAVESFSIACLGIGRYNLPAVGLFCCS